jgi:hypothetical protein
MCSRGLVPLMMNTSSFAKDELLVKTVSLDFLPHVTDVTDVPGESILDSCFSQKSG